MKPKTCVDCGTEYTPEYFYQRHPVKDCIVRQNREPKTPESMKERNCQFCDKSYTPEYPKQLHKRKDCTRSSGSGGKWDYCPEYALPARRNDKSIIWEDTYTQDWAKYHPEDAERERSKELDRAHEYALEEEVHREMRRCGVPGY